jgi:hypothetical protein
MKRILIGLAGLTAFGVILAAPGAKQPNFTAPVNGKQSHQLPCENCEIYPRIPGKALCKYCERVALADEHKLTALKEHKSDDHKAVQEHKKKGKGHHPQANQNPQKKKTSPTHTKPTKTTVIKPPKPPKPSKVYGPFTPQYPPPKPTKHPKPPIMGPLP